MIILGCHVENFGKLHDFDYSFEQGCNRIREKNGWGKSTLAAFIRVMLYGFESEGKKKITENERRRYEPWQGGVYGGSMTFTHGDRKYIVTRTFGKKIMQDTFELRDADTNLVVDDFGANIGEEIFHINSESYCRSVYIAQSDVITHATDGINAKIGNITEATGDLDSYEQAMVVFKDAVNKYSPTRATGELYRLKSNVTALRVKQSEGKGIEQALETLQNQMDEENALKAKLGKERDVLAHELEASSKNTELVAKQKEYASICEEYDRCKRAYDECADKLPSEIPEDSAIEECMRYASEVNAAKHALETVCYEMSDKTGYEKLDALFHGKTHRRHDIEHAMALAREMDMENRFVEERIKESEEFQEECEERQLSHKKMTPVSLAVTILSICALLAAVLVFTLSGSSKNGMTISAVCLVLAIAGSITTIVSVNKNQKVHARLKQSMDSKLAKMQSDIEERKADIRKKANQLDSFLDEFGICCDSTEYANTLSQLLAESYEYDELFDKNDRYIKCKAAYDEVNARFVEALTHLGLIQSESTLLDLQKLTVKVSEYKSLKTVFETAAKRKEQYEKTNDMSFVETDTKEDAVVRDSVEINEEYVEVNRLLEECNDRIRELVAKINNFSEQYDDWKELCEELALREDELSEKSHAYEYFGKTAEYLAKAKEKITSKYMDPLLKGFNKYYSMIVGNMDKKYYIDANANLTVEELGCQRDTALLSAGYQDITGICMRLSLVDAMFEDEKPVLIMDDPFVNLDDSKYEAAVSMLERVQDEYQLLYFSCR
ncbi:MAG: AAA family ATPase [Lachnospiraceae bacterium]|nr:AAA family ATPase [Candidatus Colinaster equi]